MAAVRHLEFIGRVLGPPTKTIYLVVSIDVQTLVEIDAVVSIIRNFQYCPFGLKAPIHAPKIGKRVGVGSPPK